MQIGESESYRIYRYYKTTPIRNFELFYVELDAGTSNSTIGHSEKAQEYIYIIRGELVLKTEGRGYTLNEGDSLIFDSSIEHTYINKQRTLLAFIVSKGTIFFMTNKEIFKLFKVIIFTINYMEISK